MKRITALFLAIIFCACAFCVSAHAESGSFGNISWSLEDGVLTVSGEGDMEGFNVFEPTQWLLVRDEITSVVINEGVTSIGNFAFLGCDNLVSISLPEGITSIGDFAFQSCDSLAGVQLPQSLETLMSGAFSMCSALEEITIPASLVNLEEAIFEECSSLKSVRIECTVTAIPPFTFDGCTALEEIYYCGSAEEWAELTEGLTGSNSVLANVQMSFGTAEEGEAGNGDVNCDGMIDNLDAAMILRHDALLAQLDGASVSRGDVNNDGKADSLDSSAILRYDAGLTDEVWN